MNDLLDNEIGVYESETLRISPDPTLNTMPKLLDAIDKYYHSMFLDGNRDELGNRRNFYNIGRFRARVGQKATDLDVWNFNFISEPGYNHQDIWLMERDFKFWAKDSDWGFKINEANFQRWKYGTVFLKKAGDKIRIVPIKNLIWDPTVKLEQSSFVIERHDTAAHEAREMGKRFNWDMNALERMIEIHEARGERVFPIFERYGDHEGEFTRAFMSQTFTAKNSQFNIVLSEDSFSRARIPYKQHNLEDVEGRGLGLGSIEERFESQIHRNDVVNQRARALDWKSLHVFQTRDQTAVRNLLEQAVNGDLFTVNSEITAVNQTDNADLAAYSQDEQDWEANDDRDSFSQDVIRGERAPAGTTLGEVEVTAQMAGGWFDMKREEFGEFLKEVFYDWLIPIFSEKNSREHLINILGSEEELEKYDSLVVRNRVRKRIQRHLRNNNQYPNKKQIDLWKALEGDKLKEEGRPQRIPEGYYKNAKFKLDIDITGQSINVSQKVQSLQFLFQIVASNPTVLQDRQSRKIISRLLEMVGINPNDVFNPDETSSTQQLAQQSQAQRGGSISVPQAEGAQLTETSQTV